MTSFGSTFLNIHVIFPTLQNQEIHFIQSSVFFFFHSVLLAPGRVICSKPETTFTNCTRGGINNDTDHRVTTAEDITHRRPLNIQVFVSEELLKQLHLSSWFLFFVSSSVIGVPEYSVLLSVVLSPVDNVSLETSHRLSLQKHHIEERIRQKSLGTKRKFQQILSNSINSSLRCFTKHV